MNKYYRVKINNDEKGNLFILQILLQEILKK